MKKNLAVQRKDSKPLHVKRDGWGNILTGVGIKGRDKRLSSTFRNHLLPQPLLEATYQTSDIAAKIIDLPVEEMLREGFKFIIPDDKTDLASRLISEFDRYQILSKIEEALIWAKLYGGSAIVLGLNDGLSPEQPVDFSKIKGIDYVTVLDRFRIFPANVINLDVSSQNYGYPDHYRLYSVRTVLPQIHHTRILRFEGVRLPWRLRAHFNYWGDSILGRLYSVINDFQSTHASAALIVQDFTQFIFKLKNLANLLAQGSDGENKLRQRFDVLSLTSSVMNSLIIQDGEEIEKKSTPITGLPELIRVINDRLVAGTKIPHTRLFGESPDGSNATGNSTTTQWYDYIRGEQKKILMPALLRMALFFFSVKGGISEGKAPSTYSIEFNPLWQQDEKEGAEIRWLQAQSDEKYIANQVLQPEEVANSRFGTGQFSTETQLDHKLRNQIEEAISKAQAEEKGPPPDTHPENKVAFEVDPLSDIVGPTRTSKGSQIKPLSNKKNDSRRKKK